MSDAEFEFCCLRAGSTDGTLQGIEDLDSREECRETIKFRIEERKVRRASLCSHHGSTDGTLDGIADVQEREAVRQRFEADQERRHTYFSVKLKFERKRAENRKRKQAAEQARKEADERRREHARIREERLREREASDEAEAVTQGRADVDGATSEVGEGTRDV
jgi:hypothetical protein